MTEHEIERHRTSGGERTLTSYELDLPPQSADAEDHKKVLIGRVFGYIDAHFHDPISLTSVAAAVGHEPAYLTATVRRLTGRPVHRWVTERRQSEAEHLLAASDLPVVAVAGRCGYRDPAYFARAFTRATGQSPSAWRRSRVASSRTALDAGSVVTLRGIVRGIARAVYEAPPHRRDDVLLHGAQRVLAPLRVTLNQRDPLTGRWTRYGEPAATFTDDDASIPMLLHGGVAAEFALERSYFDYYRRLGQQRALGAFYKVPLFQFQICVGALVAVGADAGAFTRERRFALEELARAYALGVQVQMRRLLDAPVAARNPAPASPATSSGSMPIAAR